MKRTYIKTLQSLAITLGAAATLSSCSDFFKAPIAENVTNETIYSNMENAEKGLNAAYYSIPCLLTWYEGSASTAGVSNRMQYDLTAILSDEAISSSTWSAGARMYYGSTIGLNALTSGMENGNKASVEHIYEEPYYYIRYAYLFLENVDKVPGATEEWKTRTKGEAKLLLAINWYELIRRYGSVPYLTGTLSSNDDMTGILDRPNLIDIINKVDGLIQEAIEMAPEKIAEESADYGRVTKATAYFLRSRLWLLAASPLFNTDTPYLEGAEDPLEICLGYAEGSDEWRAVWQKAADYSLEAIEFCHTNGYALNKTTSTDTDDIVQMYRDIFINLVGNPEIIQFSRRFNATTMNGNPKGSNFCRNLPVGRGEAIGTTAFCCPQQGFIQEVIRNVDGSELVFGQAGGENPWANADPRFHANIVYDGCDWGKKTTMEDHSDIGGTAVGRVTGYFLRKFMHDEWQLANATFDMPYYYMRLPELYLNYAEALCELDYTSNKPLIQQYLRLISARAGAYQVNLNPYTQEEARDEIRRERAVEFMFEDQRFFDVKRWKIADQKIGSTGNGYYKHGIIRVGSSYDAAGRYYEVDKAATSLSTRQMVWEDKHYLMPFPHYEVLKGLGLNQNPGF